jgi:hypothetical protein
MPKKSDDAPESPSSSLDSLAQEALTVAKKARKHNKSLNGDNFYGNKLAQLRADATNAVSELSIRSPGDTAALAELVESVFAAATPHKDRLVAVRELSHSLRTKWKETKGAASAPGNELFPMVLISKTRRGYLLTIGKQMNGCFREGWYDACAVMMRRLVEIAIIEAFEHKHIADKIKDANGNYFPLTELIDRALAEAALKLSRNTITELPKLKTLGHRSAHGHYFTAQKPDIEKVEDGVRVVVEELLTHAGLL